MFSIEGMAGYCLTLLSEATREAPTKRPTNDRRRALGSRKAANSTSNGAAEGLKAGYCLMLLSEATREAPTKRPADGRRRALGSRKAANSTSNGAAESLKAGYCLMLLSEATREAPTKRPADDQSRALGSQQHQQGRDYYVFPCGVWGSECFSCEFPHLPTRRWRRPGTSILGDGHGPIFIGVVIYSMEVSRTNWLEVPTIYFWPIVQA